MTIRAVLLSLVLVAISPVRPAFASFEAAAYERALFRTFTLLYATAPRATIAAATRCAADATAGLPDGFRQTVIEIDRRPVYRGDARVQEMVEALAPLDPATTQPQGTVSPPRYIVAKSSMTPASTHSSTRWSGMSSAILRQLFRLCWQTPRPARSCVQASSTNASAARVVIKARRSNAPPHTLSVTPNIVQGLNIEFSTIHPNTRTNVGTSICGITAAEGPSTLALIQKLINAFSLTEAGKVHLSSLHDSSFIRHWIKGLSSSQK